MDLVFCGICEGEKRKGILLHHVGEQNEVLSIRVSFPFANPQQKSKIQIQPYNCFAD